MDVKRFAQWARERIDEAAFNAILTDDAFAQSLVGLSTMIGEMKANGFERCAGELVLQMFGPGNSEAAIGALQGCDLNALLAQDGNPGAIAAEFGPAGTAQGEDGGIGFEGDVTIGPVNT